MENYEIIKAYLETFPEEITIKTLLDNIKKAEQMKDESISKIQAEMEKNVGKCYYYVDIDDNATNGIAVGDKTLMKRTTYHGYGFDFDSQWSIDEGITFPFEKHQSSKPLVNAFYAGSKAILTGEASNNSGKIIAIINDAVFDTNIIDSKWEVNVGNVPQNTMCMLSMISDGKSFSVPVNVCSQKNPNTDDVEHGDGNGDGAVDAADVVSIVNYILGKPSSSFNEKNADANGDGQILIDDAVGTVNIIMNKQ